MTNRYRERVAQYNTSLQGTSDSVQQTWGSVPQTGTENV